MKMKEGISEKKEAEFYANIADGSITNCSNCKCRIARTKGTQH